MSQIFGSNFIQQRIDQEIEAGLDPTAVTLRFPPEPSGYLHIGHARAICLNFSLAARYGGRCFLRLDDTNPTTEDQVFVDEIMRDIRWLGFEWDALYHTSDYFPQLYDYTITLIEKGLAYVDDQSPEEIRLLRGTLTEPGRESPWRNRSVAENLALFKAMRTQASPEQSRVLRAKIDMSADNLNMRDPAIWRQRQDRHHRLGHEWKIFPMYDFSHCLSDVIEGITHSLCTLEFADHKPLYDWFVEQLVDGPRPQQIEYARMNITGIVTSKRKIRRLYELGRVDGFDDPRLMTLSGLRRRGFAPNIIRDFCFRTPISRAQGELEPDYLYSLAREALNEDAPRAMAVLDPVKVVLENIEAGVDIECQSPISPQKPDSPTRTLYLSREIYIERDDFREHPEKGYRRLAPGRSVRLRSAGIIHCVSVRKDDSGEVSEVRCRFELDSKGAKFDDQGNKVRATVHWVLAASAICATIKLIPETAKITANTPSNSQDEGDGAEIPEVIEMSSCRLEASLAQAKSGICYQFERLGYFCRLDDGVWIRTLSLRSGN